MNLIRSPRCRVSRAALATLLALGLAGTGFAPVSFAAGSEATPANAAAAKATSRAQPRRDRRGPARVRVNRLPQAQPGPDSVRQCTAWLAQEYRPSGTVVVPLMRCWWEPG
jgi:hypothetical protein